MLKNEMRQKLFGQVDHSFEEQINFLSKLVTFKSLVGQEGEGQLFYAQASRDLGLEVTLFEADKSAIRTHPAYVPIDLEYAGRPNVIAEMKKPKEGRSLILNGHMDVVSPEPVSRWSVDPWGGTIKDGRLYGRGSLDMKAGLAANFFALKAILDCGFRPRGKVILESVIEEELGGSGGTLACLMKGVTADGMMISEPTRHTIFVTHPGIKYFRVRVFGRPAHAALSHEGVNAISKMVPIIQALEALDLKRARSLSYPKVEVQTGRSCNLSMGKMSAGDWVSTVAGWATLECRVGFVPGETGPQVMAEVEKTVREAVKGDEWCLQHPPEVEWFGWNTDPWVEPEDSAFVQMFLVTSQSMMTPPPELVGASGGVDTRFGQMFGTPSIAFGPKGENYHGIDEYVDLESLRNVTKVLAQFIAEWSGIME